MNIAFFVIGNNIGGGGLVATENAINLIKKKHKVTLFLEYLYDDKSEHLLKVDGVETIEVGKISLYGNVKFLLSELKRNKIDIFVTHCHYYFEIIKLFKAISALGIKVILNEHHYQFVPIYESRKKLFLERSEYLKYCDLITVIEKTSYQIWKSQGYNVAYLPNTYNFDQKVLNLAKKKQIIMAGRFVNFKQIELGIIAFSLVVKQHDDWNLVIIGKGSEQEKIVEITKLSGIADHVKILPWTSEPEVYFAESSIHLLPSFTEPFGLVIADAKLNRIPTVMFDLKSNHLVRDGIDGFRVPFGDVHAMASALDKLMSSPELRDSFGARAIETLEQNKGDYTIRVWEEIFNFVMGKDPIDNDIYQSHFVDVTDNKDVEGLIFDYNSLIEWTCKNWNPVRRINVLSKLRKVKSYYKKGTSIVLRKTRNVLRKCLRCFEKCIFIPSQALFKCDLIVLFDSNGVGFMSECLAGKFSLPTKVITPGRLALSLLIPYYLARARVFITNTNTRYTKILLTKKKDTPKIINIWHGCGYFKKFGIHENNIGLLEHRNRFGTPSYVLCSSESIVPKYAEIFGVSEKCILPFGTPRTDLLYDQQLEKEKRDNFYSRYPELKNKKIYVLAPTWRGEPFKAETAFYTPELNFSDVAKLLNNDEVLLIKNHQLVIKNERKHKDKCNLAEIPNKVLRVDDMDIMSLIIVCDVFITDFSSAYFEAMILNKPIMFYADDIDAYSAKIGFYGDYASYCPGKICDKPDAELFVKMVRDSYQYVETDKYRQIRDKFVGACDGNASSRLIKFVEELIDGKKA